MFIFDVEQNNEAPALHQLLRDWWADLWTWLRGSPAPENPADETLNDREPSESLIL